jgi:hypothetical protein
MEVGLRVFKGELFNTENIILQRVYLLRSRYPVQTDQELGWTMKTTQTPERRLWPGSDVSVTSEGVRSNGRTPPDSGPAIVAVGDSFVFGDEVSDADSWPAQFEQISGVRVVNGGVPGYGLDQTFLRARRLIQQYRPRVLLVGFVPDDMRRCAYSLRGHVPKPFFTHEGERLVLHTDHLRAPPPQPDGRLDFLRAVLGYSQLAHSVMMRVNPNYWLHGFNSQIDEHNDFEGVAGLILKQLSSLDVPSIYVVIQTNRASEQFDVDLMKKVMASTGALPVPQVDLNSELRTMRADEPARFASYFLSDHMSAQGNGWVASRIAKRLRDDGVLTH